MIDPNSSTYSDLSRIVNNGDLDTSSLSVAEKVALRLSTDHLHMLRNESAISGEVILARGYRTIVDEKELVSLGFKPYQRRVPGLLCPCWTLDGRSPFSVFRPDAPRVVEDKRKRKPDGTYRVRIIKYEIPEGAAIRLDCSPTSRGFDDQAIQDPNVPVLITEGQKKGDSVASKCKALLVLSLLGVWNFIGRNAFNANTVLADFNLVAWTGRTVFIVYDSDVMSKPEVRQALQRLVALLQNKGAHVCAIYLRAEGNLKCGVDDYLRTHTIDELFELAESPRPIAKPAPPQVELLDSAPKEQRRPLALINGKAYAAVWPFIKKTYHEQVDAEGNIRKLDPPIVIKEQSLHIIRDDGIIFGEYGRSMEELGVDVHLPEALLHGQGWSTPAFKAYLGGYRPDPVGVFNRIVDVLCRFLDFERSLTDQMTMCRFISCYIIATWFLDAFTVTGYLWPNGDKGSGKTKLLLIVARLAYLGQMIQAAGTFAALRDLADYGATLCFDDAEDLSNPRKTDPDKRTLLLAGNRKGSTVPMKEPTGDKGRPWRIRYVNTYCPRLFSATRIPDEVLGSRTIIIPLIRTDDPDRANADPADITKWPHDPQELVDDLWALSLAYLARMPKYEERVSKAARLKGRDLEPWRSALAVAIWLEDCGIEGLWKGLEQTSVDYQSERSNLESGTLPFLVIRALCECAINSVSAVSAVSSETPREWVWETEYIKEIATDIARDSELEIDPESVTVRRVGRALGKMRLQVMLRPRNRGRRSWKITIRDLARWASTYGLNLEDWANTNRITLSDIYQLNGADGVNGAEGTRESQEEKRSGQKDG